MSALESNDKLQGVIDLNYAMKRQQQQKTASSQTPAPPEFIMERMRQHNHNTDNNRDIVTSPNHMSLGLHVTSDSKFITLSSSSKSNLNEDLSPTLKKNLSSNTPISFEGFSPKTVSVFTKEEIDDLNHSLISPQSPIRPQKSNSNTHLKSKLFQNKINASAIKSEMNDTFCKIESSIEDQPTVSYLSDDFVFDDDWMMDELSNDAHAGARFPILTSPETVRLAIKPDLSGKILADYITNSPAKKMKKKPKKGTKTTKIVVEDIENSNEMQPIVKLNIKLSDEMDIGEDLGKIDSIKQHLYDLDAPPSPINDGDYSADDWLGDLDLHNDVEFRHMSPTDWLVTHSSLHRKMSDMEVVPAENNDVVSR